MFHFQTNKLILIAGPSCAGKSYLIERIQQGEIVPICNQLEINFPEQWQYYDFSDLKQVTESCINRVVIHYDLLTQYEHDNGFNNLCKLTTGANEAVYTTLYTSPKLMIGFVDLRIKKLLINLFKKREIRNRLILFRKINLNLKKRIAYSRGYSDILYNQWLNYLICKKICFWLIKYENCNLTLLPVRPWETNIDIKQVRRMLENA